LSHISDTSSDIFSCVAPYSSDASSSSDEMTPPLPARHRCPPNRYSPSQYGISVALEPTSYRDVVHCPEWQLAMAEEIAALERTSTWDLVSPPLGVRLITCKWATRLRLALMDLLHATKRVLWLVASSRSKPSL
jgi:hypothetical protein